MFIGAYSQVIGLQPHSPIRNCAGAVGRHVLICIQSSLGDGRRSPFGKGDSVIVNLSKAQPPYGLLHISDTNLGSPCSLGVGLGYSGAGLCQHLTFSGLIPLFHPQPSKNTLTILQNTLPPPSSTLCCPMCCQLV